MSCQFRGDPGDDIRGKWRARVLDSLSLIDERANVYLCVSAMKRNARGEFRRRKENFAGGLLLMIDDLGTKQPLSLIDDVPPTALIETSPRNFQAVYMFDELVEHRALFERFIKAFIAQKFLGADPGMAGVNRVFRPPAGINGKAKYNGWEVRLMNWAPDRRYSIAELVERFGLTLQPLKRSAPRGATTNRSESIRRFITVRAALREAGMIKSLDTNMEGWWDIYCPWTDGHTDGVDSGAAIREPAEENGYTGGFRCHHGSCADRGWRELTEWLAGESKEVLDLVNANAPEEIL